MSTTELLVAVRQAGIVLTVQGDRLRYDAPRGAMTPALLGHLAQRKHDLIAALTVPAFVTLRGGLTVPLPALTLAVDLEARGIRLATDDDHQLIVPRDDRLTATDAAAIDRWRTHLGAIVEYQAPTLG